MLAQAGVSTPLSLDMLPFPGIPELVDLATIYQSDLAKIGININLQKVDVATWLDQANNRKYRGFNTVLDTFTQISPFTFFTQGKSVNPNDNNSGFKDATYSQLIERAGAEPDAAARQAIYMQLNDIFLDESFMFPVAAAPARYLAAASVRRVWDTPCTKASPIPEAWLQSSAQLGSAAGDALAAASGTSSSQFVTPRLMAVWTRGTSWARPVPVVFAGLWRRPRRPPSAGGPGRCGCRPSRCRSFTIRIWPCS